MNTQIDGSDFDIRELLATDDTATPTEIFEFYSPLEYVPLKLSNTTSSDYDSRDIENAELGRNPKGNQ